MSDGGDLVGRNVLDPHGTKVGTIKGLFTREGGENACWAWVKTGLRSHAFVPLHDAQEGKAGVRVVYEKQHIKAAPDIEAQSQQITDEDADLLHEHYGLNRVAVNTVQDDDIDLSRDTREAKPPKGEKAAEMRKRHPLPKDYRNPDEDSAPDRINP